MQEHTAVVAGIPMRWLETSGSSSVVFVHGIPTSPLLWRHVIPLLPHHRSLAWEMVGYGGSWANGLGRDISLAAQAIYLVDWMTHLGLEGAIIVGHDLGGGVAQIAATHRPDLFDGIVLTNAVCYDSWPIPSVRIMRRVGAVVKHFPPKAIRAAVSLLLRRGHDDQEIATESIETHWRHYAHPSGSKVFVNQIESLHTSDTLVVQDRLPELDIPATVVWGAADQFQKIAYGERLATDLRARFLPLEGGKHFVPEDHPKELAEAVTTITGRATR